MLHLLLCLSALCLVANAAPVSSTGEQFFDISSTCGFSYFGADYDTLYVSFDGNTPYLCFGEDFVSSAAIGDCVKLPDISAQTYSVDTAASVTSFDASVQGDFTHLAGTSECGVQFTTTFAGASAQSNFYFMKFGSKTAVHYGADILSGDVIFYVGGNAEITKTYTSAGAGTYTENIDLSGCRESDVFYELGESVSYPETCETKTCSSSTGVIDTPVSSCTGSEVCLGNNICGSFCSIVGPSIIDITGAAGVMADFCYYSLFSVSELNVDGEFSSRRLTDVPFLHKVVLTTSGSSAGSLTITQGGQVFKTASGADVKVTLPGTEFGVILSKDATGVTAVYTDSNSVETTIFYDGNLLHITHKGPNPADLSVSGWCSDAANPGSSKDATNSATDCATVGSDTAGDGIVCADVTTSCTNKLTALQTAIGCSVDTAPFVTSCSTNLLCQYPEADGVSCSILDAYVKTCQSDTDWKAAQGCLVSPCVDHTCGSNEFCAVHLGNAACFCQGVFASSYRTSDTYGEPATCTSGVASATLYTCFLEEKGIAHSNLHLLDSTCTGDYDATAKTVNFEYSGTDVCGGGYTESGTKILFSNTIKNTQDGVVTHENALSVEFSCAFTQPDQTIASFTIADGSVTLTYTTEDFTWTLTVNSYTDAALAVPVGNTALTLNQKVWLDLEASDIGGSSLALLINNCWATETDDPDSTPKYDLITDSCVAPSDGSVEIVSNGVGLSSVFAFNAFEFVGAATADLHIHCELVLCIVGNNCATTCLV